MNISSDFFMLNQLNSESEEDEDLIILNNINHHPKKSSSKFSFEQFVKFHPKKKIDFGQIDTTILSAENKVKLLLSSFLHDLKREQIKEKSTNKNLHIKEKKTKFLKRRAISKKNSSHLLKGSSPRHKVKKIHTVSGNNENKNNFLRSPQSNRRKSSINTKPLYLNSYRSLKTSLSNLKKKSKKNLDSGKNNNIMSNDIEKFGEIKNKKNSKKSLDTNLHINEITPMSDIEKEHSKYKANSVEKLKKYRKSKTKAKNNNEKTKSLLSNHLYSKYGLSSIIDEKLSKITGDIREELAIDGMTKNSKYRHAVTNNNNNNFKHRFSYFNNNIKNNNNYYNNFSDIEISETGSTPKKDIKNKNNSKFEKSENYDSQTKSISSNGKENLNERIQKSKSYFSTRMSPEKKYAKINTLKNLKLKVRKSIILRPEEKLSDVADIKKKVTNIDKEKLTRSKISMSDNKNSESNMSTNNKNSDIILNKNRHNNENEIINEKNSKHSDKSSDDENENKIQEKKSFYSIRSTKTKKDIINENFRVLISKKLVYDSFDDEEVEEDSNNKYLHPDSLFMKVFDNLVSFLALSTLLYMPYYLASIECFCKNFKKWDYVLNVFVEIIYFLDFLFGFFKAYYNFEEQLITNNIAILKKYLVSWFLLDLISALPLNSYLKIKEPLCPSHIEIYPFDEVIHNFHYLMVLNKTLKIFKVNFINHDFIQMAKKLGINSTILIQSLLFFSVLHFFSCLNIFISRNTYPNWIFQSKLENSKFFDLYISSVYSLLACMTTVGYGDIISYSLTERVFQIFLLIVGCVTYSWLVSSFSSYVQKYNEQYVDFENRKQILDEIKCNYPKMPYYIYERVLRYLKYKNYNEKRDKNMIFDCLPIGLKNNLVYEMYKPIVKNFIFFKNFGNTDFIVRVILSFRPILAYKNDILLNEGDFVDDIFFVKKGRLSVQVPINIKNPEEYIDKYLYGDIFADKKHQNTVLSIENPNLLEQKNDSFFNTIILQQDLSQLNLLNLAEKEELVNKMKKEEEETEKKKNTRYIKIVSIRQNEHFGDVLMLLDQRSPLRVKVISKKAELFFLKKMDVVKISSSYPNIWRIINKRSVSNFEQIKRSIPKIVELYCKFKGFNVNKVEEKTTRKSSKKSLNKKTTGSSTKLKSYPSSSKNTKRSFTQQYNKKKIYTKKYFPSQEDFSKYNNIKTSSTMKIQKNILNNSGINNETDSSDESSDSSDISENADNSTTFLNKKLINTYNRHYKYYIGFKEARKSYRTSSSMIKEETENDSTISPLKSSNIIKNRLSELGKRSSILSRLSKLSNSNNKSKNNLINNNNNLDKKKASFKEKFLNTSQDRSRNENNYKRKRLNIEIINEKDEIFHNRSRSFQSDNETVKKERTNIVGELLAIQEHNSLTKESINDEFDTNEEIKIPTNDNLMEKRVSKSILSDKKIDFSFKKINSKNKQKSEKILYSNKSLSKDYNNIETIFDKNNLISNSKLNNSKKFFENENLISDNVITDMEISSIYINLHSINNQYYLNKYLQEMIKQLLEDDIQGNSDSNDTVNKLRSIGTNKTINKSFNNVLCNTFNNTLNNTLNNTNTLNSNFKNSNPNTPRKNNLISSSLLSMTPINKNGIKQRARSFYGGRCATLTNQVGINDSPNLMELLKKKRKTFVYNIGDVSPDKTTPSPSRFMSTKKQNNNIRRESSAKNGLGIKDNLFSLYKNNNNNISPFFFNKKKKSDLLSTINFNIKKNSQNINNPNAFYSSYFQYLLGKEKKKEERFSTNSADFSSQLKKIKK